MLKILFFTGKQSHYVYKFEYILGKAQTYIYHCLKLLNPYGFVSYDKDRRGIGYPSLPDEIAMTKEEIEKVPTLDYDEEDVHRIANRIIEEVSKIKTGGENV